MSTKTIRICDRCGKDTLGRKYFIGALQVDGKITKKGMDLCERCYQPLLRFLSTS